MTNSQLIIYNYPNKGNHCSKQDTSRLIWSHTGKTYYVLYHIVFVKIYFFIWIFTVLTRLCSFSKSPVCALEQQTCVREWIPGASASDRSRWRSLWVDRQCRRQDTAWGFPYLCTSYNHQFQDRWASLFLYWYLPLRVILTFIRSSGLD